MMERKSKTIIRVCAFILPTVIALIGIGACLPPCPPHTPMTLPGFMLGESQGGTSEVPLVAELLGPGRWMRGQVTWKQVEPEIPLGEQRLTVAEVDANPGMIHDYILNHNWSASDDFLAAMKAYELQPIMVVGLGNTNALPNFNGGPAIPDRLGKENYLGHIYLYARATIERYNGDGVDDAPGGLVVKYWQLENELNQAFLEALWGWRSPSFQEALGSAWQSWSFLTDLLHTLSRAVQIEDPEALTTTNFHTDIPASINQGLFLPSWQESIRRWVSYVDFITITALPNYYRAYPVKGETLEQKVTEASEMGCRKPVVVIEACYSSGPAERGYSEAYQAEFIQEAYDASVRAGAQGFFFFGIRTAEHHTVEITQKDLDNLAYIGALFDEGNFLGLIWFALRNMEYIQDHFVYVLWSVEPYWGLIRTDGSHKPGWDVLYAIAHP
jgi:hypothetical protein